MNANHNSGSPAHQESRKASQYSDQFNLPRRHRVGMLWQWVFQASTIVGIIALSGLLYNIINQSFGYVALENEIDRMIEICVIYSIQNFTRIFQCRHRLTGSNIDKAVCTE